VRILLIVSSAVLLCAVTGCNHKNTELRQQVPQDVGTIEFHPPKDAYASDNQIQVMNTCTPALDSLCIVYRDSFSVKGASEQTRIQKKFTVAQDSQCVKAGLNGGYAEYFWVTRHQKRP
jgi:hypothetical protein